MKRKRKPQRVERAEKRRKSESQPTSQPTWPLLRHYYPKLLTLRQYLVWSLSKSKKRQRNLLHYGLNNGKDASTSVDASVVELLDSVVVGTPHEAETLDPESIDKDITLFTQQVSDSSIGTITPTQGALKQTEIVNFAIWLIFRRHHSFHKPPHILTHGFQKHAYESCADGAEAARECEVPGVFSSRPNRHVETLRSHPWTALPALLGRGAERILGDMLLQCGLFEPVSNSTNLSQMSGPPLSDLKPVKSMQTSSLHVLHQKPILCIDGQIEQRSSKERGHSYIRFERHRMLYARPIQSAKAKVLFGLGDGHSLNRYADLEDEKQMVCVMQHMFPRQFGHHNVFTSDIDTSKTAHHFKEYTNRDEVIERSELAWRRSKATNGRLPGPEVQRSLPKRLRGEVPDLVQRLRKHHARCSYKTLLDHYCSKRASNASDACLDLASSPTQVSAFCRAIVFKVFPRDFWGVGEVRAHNERLLIRAVDKFVRLRRYEKLTLHDVMQGLRLSSIAWLAARDMRSAGNMKLSRTDTMKRSELMAELLYYLFDSFLIPLIRGHFYVTESGLSRNQLCFFRQDVWKTINTPALSSLKEAMLEPCDTGEIGTRLSKRELGVSQVRMLPKEQGMRPIINLKRRLQKVRRGQLVLGKSTNSVLTPAFSVLNYEKAMHPEMLGSAMFSAGDIHPRVAAFREALRNKGLSGVPLYFAKVDVKGCFESIPQRRLMALVRGILRSDVYNITKYGRAKLVGERKADRPGFGSKPSWKHLTKASANADGLNLEQEFEADTAEGRNRTVYIDSPAQKLEHRRAILELLEEHVCSHFVKIGKKFYRQKEGIPQGSVVSSLLCSYFYAELEREALDFIRNGQSMLLRYIDDFLVITTERKVAERFMQTMHAGLPSFGVEIKAAKSRVNFDIQIDGVGVPRLPADADFPYCGSAINTASLNLSKDKERRKTSNIPDSTTVEYSRFPGQMFYRKTLDNLKYQMQPALLSTTHNSLSTVLQNLHHSFTEVAQKTYHYIRSLPPAKQPGSKLLIRTMDGLIRLACVLMKRKKKDGKSDGLGYECCVTNAQARWLACSAFSDVFRRRQTKFEALLSWLEVQLKVPGLRAQGGFLRGVVGGRK